MASVSNYEAHNGKVETLVPSQRISDLINRENLRTIPTAKIVGIKNVATVTHYDKGEWKEQKTSF